jgi:hypothetical protein
MQIAGTHPEMSHLQQELSERRDRRLQLAQKRKLYEVENVKQRRVMEEAAVWSDWKVPYDAYMGNNPLLTKCPQFRRDQLQSDMITETTRKRRRLERDHRELQRRVPGTPFALACLCGS